MSLTIEVNPTTAASTNPLGIAFGSTAEVEFKQLPEKLLNKNVSGIELTAVDEIGIYLHKGQLDALVPWGALVTLIY